MGIGGAGLNGVFQDIDQSGGNSAGIDFEKPRGAVVVQKHQAYALFLRLFLHQSGIFPGKGQYGNLFSSQIPIF